MLIMKMSSLLLVLAFLSFQTVHADSISTVAGAGGTANNGSKGDALAMNIGQTFGVEVGPDGDLYICEVENHRVWRLDLKTNRVTTVAGNGRMGYDGDGGVATKASMNEPYEVRFDADGHMYVVEMKNHIIRQVDAKTKLMTTIAGTGTPGFSGDTGPANQARLNRPHSIAIHKHHLYIADIGNHRVRRVDLKTGLIDTIAGTGEKKLPSVGIARGRPMVGPRALYVLGDDLWIALREGHSVWKLSLTEGQLQHVAGTGKKGYEGDGGKPLLASFRGPKGIVVDDHQRVFVVDTENQVIRMIDMRKKLVSTVAGNGERGFDGDGGKATAARLDRPHGICVDRTGTVYVGDTNNHRVRAFRVR